jgi:methionyl-tRNA synthetase
MQMPTKLFRARHLLRELFLMHHQSLFREATSAFARSSKRVNWICKECRRNLSNTTTRRSARDIRTTTQKPFYVTTPIFYVNAAPHVGHLYSMVLADIIKRHSLLQGEKAILLTGTDEHGMKVQQAAEKATTDPKPFCDKGADVFRDLAARANVSHDRFMRTTDQDHKEAVQYAWQLLKEKELIYSSKHKGWYAVSDETFYPSSAVHLVIEPWSGRKHMASIETGKEVEWAEEQNYHFRLSSFREPLLEWYAKNPQWIQPVQRHKQVVDWVSEGLQDLSVSRPSSRLTWGIPVPDDPSQTIYVWLDALLNYVTAAGYPWAPEMATHGGWPANVQVIGKDIMR